MMSEPPREFPPELDDDTADIHFVPPPCQVACPVGTDVPAYIALIWEGKLEEAFAAITATNPFSSVCARVCSAPCEPACRRADSDGALAIRNLKRYVMDRMGSHRPLAPVAVRREETVAIVGGGPAGLTAAQDLALAGFKVHVYEMSGRLGGMIAWGIPNFCLPPSVIDQDIERMMARCPGIEVHLDHALGEEITLGELKQRHDAVLLAIGATWGRKLPVPGGDHPRIEDGVGFIHRINAGERPRLPDKVLVIGGGDVAVDVARLAVRLGAGEVHMMCLESRQNMPAQDREIDAIIKESIRLQNDRLPIEVIAGAEEITVRFVETTGGGLDADGKLCFEIVEGSEHDLSFAMVVAAIGQGAESAELQDKGMMDGDRVRADFDTMRTGETNVFAAGDGAFGGSSIVSAMHHGHKAAYYIKAFLDGREDPVPYRTPYRTRRVPVAQDVMWTEYPPHELTYQGLGDVPAEFAEAEAGYDAPTAIKEAARCFRCDAETGSADYSVRNREDFFAMAQARPGDAGELHRLLQQRLIPREILVSADRPPTFDDLVFLPANLSRLVIDPYRDHCSTETEIAGRLAMDLPFLVSGFDDAPGEARQALAGSLKATGCGYVGARAIGGGVPWLQVLEPGAAMGDEAAEGIVINLGERFQRVEPGAAGEGQLLGLAVKTSALEEAIPFALEADFDLLILDASGGIGKPWPELSGRPDLTVLRQAVAILRRLNREEDIDLVYFGGIRSGTDAAKCISLGCKAVIAGVALGFSLGGTVENGAMTFAGDRTGEERVIAATRLIQGMADETSILARCTGKTNIHNLEPEDLKAITLPTAKATGIPMVGRS